MKSNFVFCILPSAVYSLGKGMANIKIKAKTIYNTTKITPATISAYI